MAKKQNKSPGDDEYERLGKLLKHIIETGYPNQKQFYLFNFIRGILIGLGSVIGASIVVALLVWILSLFDEIPLLGPLIDNIQSSLKSASVVIKSL